MFERLHQWSVRYARSQAALWVLAVTSFAESALLPIPIEAVSIPLFMARRRVWLVALVATVASAAGGSLGYLIGWGLQESLGRWLLEFYGFEKEFAALQEQFRSAGWYVVMAGGLTPIPYKVVSIASGVARLNFLLFLAVSLLSRGLRFFAFALLFWAFGEPVRGFLEKHKGLLGWSMLVLLVAGFGVMFL